MTNHPDHHYPQAVITQSLALGAVNSILSVLEPLRSPIFPMTDEQLTDWADFVQECDPTAAGDPLDLARFAAHFIGHVVSDAD